MSSANARKEANEAHPTNETEGKERSTATYLEEHEEHLKQSQKAKCLNYCDKVYKEARHDLEELIIHNNTKELKRREKESVHKAKFLQQLQEESEKAQKEFDEAIQKWESLEVLTDPLGIRREIMNLKMQCDDLLLRRNTVKELIKQEIARVDVDYNTFQSKNVSEIDTIFKKVTNFIGSIRQTFKIQFNILNNFIINITNQSVEEKHKKFEELFNIMIEDVTNRPLQLKKSIEETTIEFEETFRKLKSELQQSLIYSREKLEILKAQLLLNVGKYEYNFQILESRCHESAILKGEQKRKLNNLHYSLTEIRDKFKEYKDETVSKMAAIEDSIKKTEVRILMLEEKSKRIANVSNKTFIDIWGMYVKRCKNLIKQIMSINNVLHQQHLAKEIDDIEEPSLQLSSLPSYKHACNLVANINLEARASFIPKFQTQSATTKLLQSNEQYRNLMKKILIATSDKTGFLTDYRIKRLIQKYTSSEAGLVKLDNVFEAMGIDSEKDINILIDFFIPYCYCLNCTSNEDQTTDYNAIATRVSVATSCVDSELSATHMNLVEAIQQATPSKLSIEEAILQVVGSQVKLEAPAPPSIESLDLTKYDNIESLPKKQSRIKKNQIEMMKEKMACQYGHTLVLSSIYVMKALTDFTEYFLNVTDYVPTLNDRLRKSRPTTSRLLEEKEIDNFWKNIVNTYGTNSRYFRTWQALEYGLNHYLEILQKRKVVAEEVSRLRLKNQQLKSTLKAYQTNGLLPPMCSTVKQPLFTSKRP